MAAERKKTSSSIAIKRKEQFLPIYQELTNFEHDLIDELLIGSPAIGVSAQSEDYISRFKINNTAKAEKFLARINEIAPLKWENNVKQLENRLKQDHRLCIDELADENYAAMILSKPKPATHRIEELAKKSKSSKGIVKERFLEIDSFFRHVRNSLAHGLFSRLQKENQTFYLLQDQYKSGISAQLIMSKTTLSELIELAREAN